MKKIISVLLVLSLVFIMGCASSTTKAPVNAPAAAGPSAPVQVADAGLSAEDTIGDVEADLADIDSLDEDLDMSDLDALDEELNFEI